MPQYEAERATRKLQYETDMVYLHCTYFFYGVSQAYPEALRKAGAVFCAPGGRSGVPMHCIQTNLHPEGRF